MGVFIDTMYRKERLLLSKSALSCPRATSSDSRAHRTPDRGGLHALDVKLKTRNVPDRGGFNFQRALSHAGGWHHPMHGRTVHLARPAYYAPGALYVKMERRDASKKGVFNFQRALYRAGGGRRHRLI